MIPSIPDTIFVDSDDTIFNWTEEVVFRLTGSRDVSTVTSHFEPDSLGPNVRQSDVARVMESKDFWYSLLVTEQGQRILDALADLPQHAVILTSIPPLTSTRAARQAAAIAKIMITERLGLPVMVLADAKGTEWHEMKARAAGHRKVLVDDSWTNVEAFTKAGGQGVLVPQPWNNGLGDPADLLRFLCEPIEGVDVPLTRKREATSSHGVAW